MSSLDKIRYHVGVSGIKKVVGPKEYLSLVQRDSSRHTIKSVRFIAPKIGKSSGFGKFAVTFK